MEKERVINDLVYFKDLKIVQDKNFFNFSLDSILLPNFVILTPNTKRILDLCTGNIPIPLVLQTKTSSEIIAVELQKEVYDLAQETLNINNIKSIKLINKNVKDIINDFETDTFDLITCNPPYFKYNESSIINKNEIKTIARHEVFVTLEDILKISNKLLKNGGSLCLIHRTDRFVELINLIKKYNFEPKRVQFIYPKINKESNLFLIDLRKNGHSGLKLLRPLIIHNEDGSYKEEILKMFGK